ncbi:MAG: hypothetical protein IPG64_09560 [Haliea sp.]|nr:hypothetical protein [Haliea sp.]
MSKVIFTGDIDPFLQFFGQQRMFTGRHRVTCVAKSSQSSIFSNLKRRRNPPVLSRQ